MPTSREIFERLADRGEPRGADAVFAAASSTTRVPPRALLAAAVAVAVVGTLTLVIRDPDAGTQTVAAPTTESTFAPRTTENRGPLVAGGTPFATTTTVAPTEDTTGVVPQGTGDPVVVRLESHRTCDDVLGRLIEFGAAAVGPYGLGVSHQYSPATEPAAGAEDSSQAPAAMPATDDGGHSTSNVQEEGVDEPDLLKTDGRLIVAVARGRLQVVGVAGPSLLSSLDLDIVPQSLFLVGDSAVVIGQPVFDDERGPETPVTIVDLADPAEPEVRSTTWFQGFVRTSRLQADVVRLVVAGSPRFDWAHPTDSSAEANAEAEERNRALIEASSLDAWLPRYRTEARDGSTDASGLAAGCATAYTPTEQSGFETTTIVTLNPGSGTVFAGTSVTASPHVVYANQRSLYIVTSRCCESDGGSDIHRFDLTSPTAAPYRSSGQVPGFPLNQFALSERDGNLRIATTTVISDARRADDQEPPRDPIAPPPPRDTDSAIFVLAEQSSDLRLIGEVRGLGEEGETIHSVRYEGDFGYVTTFRRTDPLYVVDLGDPTAPRVRGELHVPGFSSFLQHVGDDRLIGIGRDADETGQVGGLQLSRFDVSIPAAPARDDLVTYEQGASLAEHDHLAFMHWAPRDLVVVPFLEWDQDGCSLFAGALMLDIGDGIDEIGRVVHHEPGAASTDEASEVAPIVRSAVVGADLVTMSSLGVAFGGLDDGAERAFVPFAGGPVEQYGVSRCPQPKPEPEPEPDDDGGLLGL